MYCVYLTCYAGSLMPPFYIGSTSVEMIGKGYRGSVRSVRWGKIWKQELKESPHLFETTIIAEYETRQEALESEEFIHRSIDVVNNPLYINMAYANKGCFGAVGPAHPMYGIPNSFKKHTKETKRRLSQLTMGQNKGVKRSAETKAKISTGNKGKKVGVPLSLAHRSKLSSSMIGKNVGKTKSVEARAKMSKWKKENYVGEGNPFFEKTHSEESIAKMQANSKHAVSLTIKGVTYASKRLACEALGLKLHQLNKWAEVNFEGEFKVQGPKKHTEEELERMSKNSPHAKPVAIDGTTYRSMKVAAKELGLTMHQLRKLIKTINDPTETSEAPVRIL